MDGWSLLFKTVENRIRSKPDVFIAFVHWQLIHAGTKCIGIGDDKTLHEADEETEELPDGWNISNASYTLRYKYHDVVYVLMGMVINEYTIMLNLLNGASLEVSNAEFNFDQTVLALKGKLNVLIPNFPIAIDRLRAELFDPVLSAPKPDASSSTAILIQPNMPIDNNWMFPFPYYESADSSPVAPSRGYGYGYGYGYNNISFSPAQRLANMSYNPYSIVPVVNFIPHGVPMSLMHSQEDLLFLQGAEALPQGAEALPQGAEALPQGADAPPFIPAYYDNRQPPDNVPVLNVTRRVTARVPQFFQPNIDGIWRNRFP